MSGVQSRLHHTHSLPSVTVCDSVTMCSDSITMSSPESLGNGCIVVLLIVFGIQSETFWGVSWGSTMRVVSNSPHLLHAKVYHALWEVSFG